jgi:Cu+-exporting ATPase
VATEWRVCLHCGDVCGAARVAGDAGVFCCAGCASVYALLQAHGLDAFYTCDVPAGVSQRDSRRRDSARFTVLDDPAVRSRFILSEDGRVAQARFAVPSLHCASCVWLLERLARVDDRIGRSEVDLLRRTVTVAFDSSRLRLSGVAAAIASVGYEPLLVGETPRPSTPARRRLYTQIGVAGFAFGNIMLFSIPRYANGAPIDGGFQRLFDTLNVALALPVLVYSASDYFRGAWQALRHRTISLDVPIVIGLLALVGRSLVDIGTGRGAGYLDSFAGLVFFLLIGRLFQQQAFDWIGFDRTFRSFFPLSVLAQQSANTDPAPVPIDRLHAGDRIVLRPGEVVPVDARLADDRAVMDYAFLTGECEPVEVRAGGLVRAGGRLTRSTARLDVVREVDHSELAGLWGRRASAVRRPHWLTDVSARFGAWFVVVALGLAAVGAALWWPDTARALEVATAVLIIACPCALTLAAPITLGTAMTMLGRRGWYLKDPAALLDLSRVDSIVFDKTGTLTASGHTVVAVSGLTEEELGRVRALASGSIHPISRALAGVPVAASHVVGARDERIGRGLRGVVDGHDVAIGSVAFITGDCGIHEGVPASGTVVAIGGRVRGTIAVSAPVRAGLEAAVEALGATCRMSLLSGDRDAGDERWGRLFGARATFGQSAAQKREHIAALTAAGEHVLMVGDGLNDAGAFEAADIGLAVSDDTACIVPACDVVVSGARLAALPQVLVYARRARRAIVVCFVISLFYNAIGLSLALAGLLSPLVAAILMPISSLTVVGTSVGMARWWARAVPVP